MLSIHSHASLLINLIRCLLLLNLHFFLEKLSLMNVLRKRLTLLLKDKEETAMSTITANGWLCNEAASFEAICKAGTLRYETIGLFTLI